MTSLLTFENEYDDTSIQITRSLHSQSPNVTKNTSVPDGCMEINFSQMEYLPWDNPDNIVSAEVEAITYRVKIIMLAFLYLIGGPANVINMAVFFKQGLKDRVNLCLFALSLADEFYLTGAMLRFGEQVYKQFTTNDRYGPIFTFMLNNNLLFVVGFLYASSILSAIIASERCLCVLSPLKFQTLLRTRTMAVIIVAVYVVVLGLFFFVAFRYRLGCMYDPVSGEIFKAPAMGTFYKDHQKFIDFLDSSVFGVGLPGVAMIVVITTTIITVVKLRQIVTWRAGTSSSISPREVALTKMLIGSSILFIACLSFVALIRFSWIFFPEMNARGRHENFYLSSVWIHNVFSYINSTFNIFVYYTMGSRYRETFWALFRRKVQKE